MYRHLQYIFEAFLTSLCISFIQLKRLLITSEIKQAVSDSHAMLCLLTEIVRDVVEARAELYRAAGEREADRVPSEDSISLPSLQGEEEEDGA